MRPSHLPEWIVILVGLTVCVAAQSETGVFRLGSLETTNGPPINGVVATVTAGKVSFSIHHPAIHNLKLQIFDSGGQLVYESGQQPGADALWEFTGLDRMSVRPGKLRYRLEASNRWNETVGTQLGEIRLPDVAGGEPAVVALTFDDPDNFTIAGSLGVGIDVPQRAVHLKGSNAVFRMDRSTNSAAFLLVRTDASGNPLKTYVVGVDASGPNQGEFIINDLGTEVGGSGPRRLTITNEGNAILTGSVAAGGGFFPASALRLKTNIVSLTRPLETLQRLRGVRFDWKATGRPALGLIAEDVAPVLPEAVSTDVAGQAQGVNYDSLVALLVEAFKARQREITSLTTEINRLEDEAQFELLRLQERTSGRDVTR